MLIIHAFGSHWRAATFESKLNHMIYVTERSWIPFSSEALTQDDTVAAIPFLDYVKNIRQS